MDESTNRNPALLLVGPTGSGKTPLGDLVARAEKQHRTPNGNHVAMPQDPDGNGFPVDLGPVRTLQVGQDQLVLVFLDLDVEPADPLIIELNGVPLPDPS